MQLLADQRRVLSLDPSGPNRALSRTHPGHPMVALSVCATSGQQHAVTKGAVMCAEKPVIWVE